MNTLQGCQGNLVTTVALDGVSKSGDTPHDQEYATDVHSDAISYRTGDEKLQGDECMQFSTSYVHPDFPVCQVKYAFAKRLFDITFSALILLLFWPFMLLIAVLIKLTSPGPVIFKQPRVGRGGRHFTCYKFRSMCVDAEIKQKELAHLNEVDGPVFKIKRDPRITPIGALLRKLSIDELPQFVNVIRGEMSVVGPRPPLPCEVETYGSYERRRLSVLPGITCLWQIGGRSDLPFERWMELDMQYIDTMSLWQDLVIVIKTVPAVAFGWGAH